MFKKFLHNNNLIFITRGSILLVVFLFAVQILVSVVFSTVGKTMGDFEEKAANIDFENKKIIEELAGLESIMNISSKAAELGFTEVPIIYPPSENLLANKSKLNGQTN